MIGCHCSRLKKIYKKNTLFYVGETTNAASMWCGTSDYILYEVVSKKHMIK